MSIATGNRSVFALALALGLLCCGLFAANAAAVVGPLPYQVDQQLSLTGDCSTYPADSVPDPDCTGTPPAYPPPPDRPAGRFDRPFSLTVDDWGNLYVASRSFSNSEGRIDIFDPEGHFITELSAPNGPLSLAVDTEGNLYVYEGATLEIALYPPSTYEPATGEIAYDPADRVLVDDEMFFLPNNNGLAIDRRVAADPGDDRLFAIESERIRVFGSAEEGNPLLDTVTPPGLVFGSQIAVDSVRRRVYTQTCKSGQENCVIWVFSADAPYERIKDGEGNPVEITGLGTPPGKFKSTQGWISVAVDETNGHLFVGDLRATTNIYEYDENFKFVVDFDLPEGALSTPVQSAVADNPENPDPADLNPKDNYRFLFVPLSAASGSAIAFAPPSIGPPVIKDTRARGIGLSEVELEAQINPKELATEYWIEYVTQAQFEIDGFESATLVKSATLPAGKGFKRVSAVLAGLNPGTAYRFRVRAENELGADEEEAAFSTYNDAPITPNPQCANGPLRSGPSLGLPDCRAYELVTPPDTGGRAPQGPGFEGERFSQLQATPSGDKVSFEVLSGALPGFDATGYIYGDPYLATRTASGWSTALTGPNGAEVTRPKPGSPSPDQRYLFWTAEGKGTAVLGAVTTYIRYPDGTSHLIGRGSIGEDPRAIGLLITEGASHVVFQTTEPGNEIQLEPEAPPTNTGAVYDRTRDPVSGKEETHVVSLLPGDVTPQPGEDATYAGASPEGNGIAFEIGGTLYLRVANQTTYEIGAGAVFAGLAAGGERIFYLDGGDLKAFDVGLGAEGEEIVFADTAAPVVPVNVAPQGTRAYFVSTEAIAESGPGPAGDLPQPGAQNLYLSREGQVEFLATVTPRDVEGFKNEGTGARLDGLGLWTLALAERELAIASSRLNASGQVLLFQARGELTGYDSGTAAQIYRYDEAAGTLACLSCPPSATPATGGAVLQSSQAMDINAPFSSFAFVPGLAAGGQRAFFESTEALVTDDVDGLRDVYEWEGPGIGSCPATRAGGCVYLISSGGSQRDDYIFAHSQSGADVFISTADILVPGDENTTSIYDARVGGGFPLAAPEACEEGEQCRPTPTPPPVLPAPQSGAGGPSGNVVEPNKPKRCPKGKRKVKRKGKVVCVKKKGKKQGKRGKAGATRRAGR